jgi:hypothetical protein
LTALAADRRTREERDVRRKPVTIGAQVVTPTLYVIFQMAEAAVPRKLFAAILERIGRLRGAAVSCIPAG